MKYILILVLIAAMIIVSLAGMCECLAGGNRKAAGAWLVAMISQFLLMEFHIGALSHG